MLSVALVILNESHKQYQRYRLDTSSQWFSKFYYFEDFTSYYLFACPERMKFYHNALYQKFFYDQALFIIFCND